MSHNITVKGGKSVRLPTKGKYCDRDIVVTAEGGVEDFESLLNEQEELIAELQDTLRGKATGGGEVVEPIIEPLEVTENGTYTAPDGVDGYSPVTVNVASGGEDLFDSFVERTATEFESPSIKTISQYICYNFTTLKTINFPNLTTIGAHAFYGCTALTGLSVDNLKSIGTYAFYNCLVLNEPNFPEVTSVGTYAFRQCRKLPTVCFPKLNSIGAYALSRCNVLTKADLGLAQSVPANLFAEDSKLGTLILRKSDGVATLAATSAFSGTLIASGTGYVYCPAALLEEYRVASNWSTYAAQFRAIEDYPEICGGDS